MEIQLEQTILRNLLTNDEYARKVAAFLSPDYFEGVYKALFKEFTKFIQIKQNATIKNKKLSFFHNSSIW